MGMTTPSNADKRDGRGDATEQPEQAKLDQLVTELSTHADLVDGAMAKDFNLMKKAFAVLEELVHKDSSPEPNVPDTTTTTRIFTTNDIPDTPSKQQAACDQIEFWEGIKIGGNRAIVRTEELKNLLFTTTENPKIKFYHVADGPQLDAQQYQKQADQVANLIDGGATACEQLQILMLPDSKFAPARSGGSVEKEPRIFLCQDNPNLRYVFNHEYVHQYLKWKYGDSTVTAIVEGAATRFARLVDPSDQFNNMERYSGYADVDKLKLANRTVGRSNTEMLENAGKPDATEAEKYDTSYRFGYELTGFILGTYGPEEGKAIFLDIYQYTCRQNIIHNKTGETLVKNGQRLGHSRDIMEQAVRTVLENHQAGIKSAQQMFQAQTGQAKEFITDPTHFFAGLDQYMKDRLPIIAAS